MTKPQIKEHNSETDEIIIREMTDEEYQSWLNNQAAIQEYEEKVEADALAKAALLERLGITEEEARLLLS
jgi:adenylate kinase